MCCVLVTCGACPDLSCCVLCVVWLMVMSLSWCCGTCGYMYDVGVDRCVWVPLGYGAIHIVCVVDVLIVPCVVCIHCGTCVCLYVCMCYVAVLCW